MKRIGFLLLRSLAVLGVIGIVFWAAPAIAGAPNSMTNMDYAGTPPFASASSTLKPNVLIFQDNTASMRYRQDATNISDGGAFSSGTKYTGMLDALTCYTYDTVDTRFEPATTKATLSTACSITEWDGNFVNWVVFRRVDAVKKALTGGICAVTRNADGNCPPTGTPSMVTMKHQEVIWHPDDWERTDTTPSVSSATATGRVPQSVRQTGEGNPGTFYFHIVGNAGALQGSFCIDNDTEIPSGGHCGDASDGFDEKAVANMFKTRVAYTFEPTGVIQDVGDRARFGLMVMTCNPCPRDPGYTAGVKVLTPIGSRQSVNKDDNTIETFNTNKAAMLDSSEEALNMYGTPLGEGLSEAMRYIAQVKQNYLTSQYSYPIAYSTAGSNGVSFGTAGIGGIGPLEQSVLTGSETCPAGYITGGTTITCAAGRDPFFYGSNHTPAWASPSTQVTCCKTYIILFTDGAPDYEWNVPTELRDFGHGQHGTHCTGGNNADPPSPLSTCSTGTDGKGAGLSYAEYLSQHKTDSGKISGAHFIDDVAYWGHINDLRDTSLQVKNAGGTVLATLEANGHPLPGMQNVAVYSFYAFGEVKGREILMASAKLGAFDDGNGNKIPDNGSTTSPAPCDLVDLTKPCEWDKVINATGAAGRDNLPDAYFESSNVDDLQDKLTATIASILQQSSSGTTVSVMASSSTGEGAVYQAYFFPNTFVTIGSNTTAVAWTGFTQSLFIDKFGNTREDYSASGCTGLPDGKLVLTHDCIIKMRLETNPSSPNVGSVVVERFKDDGTEPGSTAGDGIADTTTPFEPPVTLSTGGVSNVKPMWEGGRRLALLTPGATCEGSNTWPKAGNMSQGGNTCRRILTWADVNNDGLVGGTETLEFSTANISPTAGLCPYLGASLVIDCNSAVGANRDAAQNEALKIVNWVRGNQVSGLRDRTFNVVNDAGATVQAQWKLGDVVHATPVVVGPPIARYDATYGDATYAQFFQRYKDRRNVAYVGANDGMLHAFNAGFFSNDGRKIDGSGPTVQVRYTTTPKQLGESADCAALPCDASVTTYSFRSDAPLLGAELWAFIPQDLLPQLRWLTAANYDHMYYVDLTPRVTEARVFTPDADHPGGWGTVLIGGFRMGGSCAECVDGKGTPRVVQADFNYDGDTTDNGNATSGSDYRTFLSSYFVLDITNPEKEPKLLWVYRDDDLGLTTSAPAIIRVNPSADAKTSSTNERWFVVFGSGPTHLDAFSTQASQFVVVDLKLGPAYVDVNKSNGSAKSKGKKMGNACPTSLPCMSADSAVASGAIRAFDTGVAGAFAFMADPVTMDFNLDFRVDVVYAGSVICNGITTGGGCDGSGPKWKGAMWRLTTNGGNTNPDTWGVSTGCSGPPYTPRCPTKLISDFAYSTPQATTCTNVSSCKVGPITAAPGLTQDDSRNLWLFFGTGRFYAIPDKTNADIQHFFGVKDCIINGACTDQSVERNNLFNSSNVVVCSSCAPGTNVSTTGSTASFTIGFSASGGNLVSSVQATDGWFTTFNDCSTGSCLLTAGERNISTPTLIGGTVFFTTFTPTTDLCQGTGTGRLYAVFYLTGGPYTGSAIGTVTAGGNTLAKKSISLGQGMTPSIAIHIGAKGQGDLGNNPSGKGCTSGVTSFSQAAGELEGTCVGPALNPYSRMLTWRDL